MNNPQINKCKPSKKQQEIPLFVSHSGFVTTKNVLRCPSWFESFLSVDTSCKVGGQGYSDFFEVRRHLFS